MNIDDIDKKALALIESRNIRAVDEECGHDSKSFTAGVGCLSCLRLKSNATRDFERAVTPEVVLELVRAVKSDIDSSKLVTEKELENFRTTLELIDSKSEAWINETDITDDYYGTAHLMEIREIIRATFTKNRKE